MSGDQAEQTIVPNIPVDNDNESHKLVTPLDVQNTDVGNFIHLLIKDKYTPKYSVAGLKKGVVIKVIEQKELFEYSPKVEYDTFFRKEKDSKRYKVYVYGEAGKLDVQPETWIDNAAINLLNDYSLSDNYSGDVSVNTIVWVDVLSKTIERSAEKTVEEKKADSGSNTTPPPPSAKDAAAGPPTSNTPVTIDKIPQDITEDECWALEKIQGKYQGKYQGKIKLKAIVSYSGQKMRVDAADMFNKMCKDAAKDNVKIMATSGHRSQQTQISLYNDRWEKKYPAPVEGNRKTQNGKTIGVAAYPGTSNHQSGIAVDIDVGEHKNETNRYAGSMGQNKVFLWLKQNASKYNFNNKEGASVNEPWHWVYGGREPNSDADKDASKD